MDLAPDDSQLIRLTLAVGPTRTDLALGRGLLARAGDFLGAYRSARLLLVADAHVAPLYALPLRDTLAQAAFDAHVLTIPAGESAKTLDTLIDLYAACQTMQ